MQAVERLELMTPLLRGVGEAKFCTVVCPSERRGQVWVTGSSQSQRCGYVMVGGLVADMVRVV